jgi:hypothetical protein
VAEIIVVDDLPSGIRSNELAQTMVDGANAKASRVAPCLASTDPVPTADQLAEARLILVGAVKRWAEASSGAFQAEQAGPFAVTMDTRQRVGFNLWPSEIEALQSICSTADTSGAFSLDTAPSLDGIHAPWCALAFGATYCSCGADIAGYPIYEVG